MSSPLAERSLRTATVGIVGGRDNSTNRELERAWRALGIDARVLAPASAVALLRRGDVALGRIDVRRTLDGVERGLLELQELANVGVRLLNRPAALLAAHDKLRTARLLAAAGLPQPRTVHLRAGEPPPGLALPLVLKPRFGSWGSDVLRCDNRLELERALALLAQRHGFARQGVLVQELVPSCGHDLRLLVAGGRIAGAIRRRARPGEWRTNISLGGRPERADPPAEAQSLALAAAAALGADLVGVDLLPTRDGYTIVELNGAVDFDDPEYSSAGSDVYAAVAEALELPAAGRPARSVRSNSAGAWTSSWNTVFRDPRTNVSGDGPVMTGRMALAHPNEFPDHTRLELEGAAKREQEPAG